jgi:hypothetical protein
MRGSPSSKSLAEETPFLGEGEGKVEMTGGQGESAGAKGRSLAREGDEGTVRSEDGGNKLENGRKSPSHNSRR